MKKKTAALIKFINGLHEFIISNPQFRKDTKNKSEVFIQAEIRPLIIQYLENYFKSKGYKDHSLKANKSFYWEGQEGSFGKKRAMTFASRNYPDFIIKKPLLVFFLIHIPFFDKEILSSSLWPKYFFSRVLYL